MNPISLLLFLSVVEVIVGRIQRLEVEDDRRSLIDLSYFGFLPSYGSLSLSFQNLSALKHNEDPAIGFSLSKNAQLEEWLRTNPRGCVLKEDLLSSIPSLSGVIFVVDVSKKQLVIKRYGDLEKLVVCPTASLSACFDTESAVKVKRSTNSSEESKSTEVSSKAASTSKNNTGGGESEENGDPPRRNFLPLDVHANDYVDGQFHVFFNHKQEGGQYYLIYHNCYNLGRSSGTQVGANFSIEIVAKNGFSYLSAGELITPQLYFCIALIFFMSALLWVYLIRKKAVLCYKIHYLMAVLVFLKSFSLLFHGINFYFTGIHGHQQEALAILYYCMHLLKGAVLFGVIILIGTGWTFFKHFLTDRDKRILVVVIPLQVLDNVALIIVEESEQGRTFYQFWWRMLIFIDMLCCAAIILPVIWSIRHLQEASGTDGKAAFNIEKLKLFRQFYILVICYIYTTRIIKYLVVFTIPFNYSWVVIIVEEGGNWLFFAITGYKFKPATNNPYLKLSQDDEISMDEAITESGLTEAAVRIKKPAGLREPSGGANAAEQQELID